MLNWFDARDAEAFGRSLALFFIKRIPPREGDRQANPSSAKLLSVTDKLDVQIQHFKTKHKLNIYKKAKLGSAFKYALLDAGHTPAFVDSIVTNVMLKL